MKPAFHRHRLCAALVLAIPAVLAGGAALAQAPAPAPAPAKPLPAQSEIAFVSRQMGVPVTGRFTRYDAQLAFDPKRPQAGRVAIAVDTASASLGIAEADAELPKAPWFDARRFPRATFESTSMKLVAPGRLEVAGRLSVKGAARDVTVPVALSQAAGVTTASGTFTLRRLDFRVGEGEWTDTSMVADDVQVKFKLAFGGIGPL